MGELTDEQIDAAAERGRIVRQNEPRAAAVRYDPSLQRMIVDPPMAAASRSRRIWSRDWRGQAMNSYRRLKSSEQAMAFTGKSST